MARSDLLGQRAPRSKPLGSVLEEPVTEDCFVSSNKTRNIIKAFMKKHYVVLHLCLSRPRSGLKQISLPNKLREIKTSHLCDLVPPMIILFPSKMDEVLLRLRPTHILV